MSNTDAGDQHTRFKLLPDLPGVAFECLVDEIRRDGVREPIRLDEEGNILDGFQRLRACRVLGIDCPREVVRGLDEAGKLQFVVDANAERVTQNKRAVAANLMRILRNQYEVAAVMGLKQYQVSRLLKNVSNLPSTSLGSDGKEYDMGRRRRRPETGRIDAGRYMIISSNLRTLAAQLDARSIDAIITETAGPIRVGDQDSENEEAASTAAIMGSLARQVLKPGGDLVIMVNRSTLQVWLAELSKHLTYVEVLAYELEGGRWSGGAKTADWRPVLWFTSGQVTTETCWPPSDELMEGIPQDASTVHQGDLLAAFSRPGDTVLDPITENLGVLLAGCGSGRKLIAATTADIEATAEVVDCQIYDDQVAQIIDTLWARSGVTTPGELVSWIGEAPSRLTQLIRDEFEVDDEESITVSESVVKRLARARADS